MTEKDKSGLTPPSIAVSFNCRINPFFFMPVQKRKNRPCLLRLGRLVSFSCAAKLTFSGSLSRTTKVGKSRLYSVAFLPMCLIGYIWDYLALVDFVL